MSNVNEELLSEINAIPDSDEEMRIFLLWLISFEDENMEKEQFSYKKEITQKLDTMSEK